jgi:hypothetical protein
MKNCLLEVVEKEKTRYDAFIEGKVEGVRATLFNYPLVKGGKPQLKHIMLSSSDKLCAHFQNKILKAVIQKLLPDYLPEAIIISSPFLFVVDETETLEEYIKEHGGIEGHPKIQKGMYIYLEYMNGESTFSIRRQGEDWTPYDPKEFGCGDLEGIYEQIRENKDPDLVE